MVEVLFPIPLPHSVGKLGLLIELMDTEIIGANVFEEKGTKNHMEVNFTRAGMVQKDLLKGQGTNCA